MAILDADLIVRMAPPIEACPAEVIEEVVRYLTLADICSLRLSSRYLATNATQDIFKSYFLAKHVDLAKESLEKFVQITKPGSLGCLVENLIVVGIAIETTPLETILNEKARWIQESQGPIFSSTQHECDAEELAEVEHDLQVLKGRQREQQQLKESAHDIALLSDAFRNLKTDEILGKSPSLSLEVVIYRQDAETRQEPVQGGDWQTVWRNAAHVFNTTMASLANSGLPIDKLDIFNSTLRCSLACNELGCLEDYSTDLKASFRELKSLSLSLSDPLHKEADLETDAEGLKRPRLPDRNFAGLPILLGLGPQLEELQLHWNRLRQSNTVWDIEARERLFEAIARTARLPPVKKCHVRGVSALQPSFLDFLRRTPIKSLLIENVYLMRGTWEVIFEYCTS